MYCWYWAFHVIVQRLCPKNSKIDNIDLEHCTFFIYCCIHFPVQELFEVISEGQALHPDPEDVSSEESESEDEGAVVLEDIQPLNEGAEFFRTEEDLQFFES